MHTVLRGEYEAYPLCLCVRLSFLGHYNNLFLHYERGPLACAKSVVSKICEADSHVKLALLRQYAKLIMVSSCTRGRFL